MFVCEPAAATTSLAAFRLQIYGSQSGRYSRASDEGVDQTVEPLVTTEFVEWCSKSFQQPIFSTIYSDTGGVASRSSLVDASRPFTLTRPTDWALLTHEGLVQRAHADVENIKNEVKSAASSIESDDDDGQSTF